VADADAKRSPGRGLAKPRRHPQARLAFPDEVVQDAGIRHVYHRSITVPSSDLMLRRSIYIERCSSYDNGRTLVNPFVREFRTGSGGPSGGYHGAVIALGIDPGTAICGFGVVALESGRLRLIDAGCIRTKSDETDANRLRQLHQALRQLLGEHKPERVGVERLFFQRNVQTAMAVGQARGVALLVAAEADLTIDEPTPNEVKQAVCGNGAAEKQQVAAMVERLLGVSLAGVPDDATDALAIAIGTAYRAAAEPRAVIG
jgi:crossover junction endodeoxyribonuclease RuvC